MDDEPIYVPPGSRRAALGVGLFLYALALIGPVTQTWGWFSDPETIYGAEVLGKMVMNIPDMLTAGAPGWISILFLLGSNAIVPYVLVRSGQAPRADAGGFDTWMIIITVGGAVLSLPLALLEGGWGAWCWIASMLALCGAVAQLPGGDFPDQDWTEWTD